MRPRARPAGAHERCGCARHDALGRDLLALPALARINPVQFHLFVATNTKVLRSYGTQDPLHPALLGTTAGVATEDMVERDGKLYVADGDVGLRILDSTDPTAALPELGRATQPGANAIALYGSLAYVSDRDDCVVYDVADPTSPGVVGQFAHGMRPEKSLVANDHLFLMGDLYGVDVYSLANPQAPALVLDELPGSPLRTEGYDVAGHLLALVGLEGLWLYVIQDPASPVPVFPAPPPYGGQDVVLSGNEIHIASGSGYRVLLIDPAVSAPPASVAGLVLGSTQNPSRGRATFYFESARTGPVQFRLYDVAGRLVDTWTALARADARGTVTWNGTDRHGRPVSTGTYFLHARAGTREATLRVVWLR